MAYELVYTSAPQGVYRGSSGFCVVACTKGLGPRLVAALEGYSAYKPLYPHYAENAWSNPVSRSHYIFEANGVRQHILSRICFNGVDYTGRSNKLASHLVLSPGEADNAAGGPASLLLRDELFKDAAWQIHAEFYDTQREIPATAAHPGKCSTWQSVTGDAGWGGYLAECFLDQPQRNIYIIYDPEQQELVPRLFDEAINLLPKDKRWEVTFNSYFVTLPAGASCSWRGVPRDSDAMRMARRSPANIVIDLAKPGQIPSSGKMIEYARTGIAPAAPAPEPEETPPPTVHRIKAPSKPAIGTGSKKLRNKSSQPVVSEVTSTAVLQIAAPSRRKKPWLRIALVAAAAVVVVAATSAVAVGMWHDSVYRRALKQCTELRGDLAAIGESRAELEKAIENANSEEVLKELSAKLEQLSATLDSVEEKSSGLDRHRELFEDALDSGKLTDAQNTPGGIVEACGSLREELKTTAKRLQRRQEDLQRRRRLGLLPPPVEKTVEKPTPEKAEPSPQPVAPPPKSETAETVKKLVPPDKPELLWLRASVLYKYGDEAKKFDVALGEVAAGDIEILFLPKKTGDKECYHPGDELTCRNAYNDVVVLKTAYDAATGVLTVTAEKYPLPEDRMIMVRVKLADGSYREYPLYFRVGVSKPDFGKLKYRMSISGAKVALKVTGAEAAVPKLIYDGGPPKALKYELRCARTSCPLADGEGLLVHEWKDDALAKIIAHEKALAALKGNVVELSAEFVRKIDLGSLPEEKQRADWENKLLKWKRLDKSVHENISAVAAFLKEPDITSPDALYRKLKTPGVEAELKKMNDLVNKYPNSGRKDVLKAKRELPAVTVWKEAYEKSKSMRKKVIEEIMNKLPAKSLPGSKLKTDKTLAELIKACSEQRKSRIDKLKDQYREAEFVVFYDVANDKPRIVGKTKLKSK